MLSQLILGQVQVADGVAPVLAQAAEEELKAIVGEAAVDQADLSQFPMTTKRLKEERQLDLFIEELVFEI